MGGLWSYFRGYSTEPDPATGLSAQDKYLVAYSWGLARKEARAVGSYLFELLFRQHPEVQDMFPFAKGRQWNELEGDPRLAAHITSVLYALTSFVDNINDTPILEAMLRKTADNHARRKITIQEFKVLGTILMQTLGDKLGPRVMNNDTVAAWTKTYGVILQIIEDQMNKSISQ